jgi:hypothetical protein
MSNTPKNPIAVALGKLAKGKPKNFTRKEIGRRRRRMIEMNRERDARLRQRVPGK